MSAPCDNPLRLVRPCPPWRNWDGAVVIFDPLSGDTHRIAAPGGHILALLTESERSRTAIESALQSVVAAEKTGEALDLLMAMNLVESA